MENLRDLKDNNRELRTENAALREKLAKAEEELEKKNAYLRTLKGDAEENRVRALKKEEAECERLRE
jgi:regulator of replication initiation timing